MTNYKILIIRRVLNTDSNIREQTKVTHMKSFWLCQHSYCSKFTKIYVGSQNIWDLFCNLQIYICSVCLQVIKQSRIKNLTGSLSEHAYELSLYVLAIILIDVFVGPH